MKRLPYFLYKYRAFSVFLLLELISILLILKHNTFPTLQCLSSSSYVVGNVYNFTSELKNYFSLKEENEKLLNENALLRQQFLRKEDDSTTLPSCQLADTCLLKQYDLIPANVINNSIGSTKNYLTINRGARHGITPGMGVISNMGIVGKVKAVSDRFATIISLLHTDVRVAAQILDSGIIGTVAWPGKDSFKAELLYVPRHVKIAPGDKVVTSGYNAIFPEGISIGQIESVKLKENATFYDMRIDISTQFCSLQHVYVIKNYLKQEKDSLEQYTKSFYE